ncbi:Hypothetical predicted protein [Podarcis lilfordi]|uniref:Uncharacterized protein n=1 Tax=Podarcis lilfordi TaxID=74358 RepID=A0AA35KX89_9SAUR|nr:Hypothetical predicted protein [Podarcis lilfordi]
MLLSCLRWSIISPSDAALATPSEVNFSRSFISLECRYMEAWIGQVYSVAFDSPIC